MAHRPVPGRSGTDVDQTSHHIFLNTSSGTAATLGVRPEQLVTRFAALGLCVSIDADKTRSFTERLTTARNSAAPVLVAAGGDGTVTALAEVAIQSGKRLAVLPLGTANLLARDLAIPLDIDAWFEGYGEAVPKRIDVGEINGRVFLHNVVLGAIPGIAGAREHLRGRRDLAVTIGFFRHFVYRLSRLRRFAVEVTPGHGEPHIERVQSIAVVNNTYDEGPGRFFSRARLDQGTLSLHLLRHLSVMDSLRLGIRMMLGSWRQDDVLEIKAVRSVLIRPRRTRVRVMLDGEIEMMESPLAFRLLPLALTVMTPPDETEPPVPDIEAAAEA